MNTTTTITKKDIVSAQKKMQEVWGYKNFREGQDTIISSLLKGHDVLAVMPTSFGKSLCYQLPSIMETDGITLVISPLISLMLDQCEDALRVGIQATYINSSISIDEQHTRMQDIRNGDIRLLYVSPERLSSFSFMGFLRSIQLNYIAIDEAHCVSSDGHDFRPMYQRIQDFTKSLTKRVPIIACTATCPASIENSVVSGIGLTENYERVVTDPIRPNFEYKVLYGNMWEKIKPIAKEFDMDGRHIVYTTTRKGCEILADIIAGIIGMENVAFYHAGLSSIDRMRIQDNFKNDNHTMNVVVATCAFGMGINIPDIRTVTHCGIPPSIESYVQEIGRGGRDGKQVTVTLIADNRSIEIRENHIKSANPPWWMVNVVWSYLSGKAKTNRISETENGLVTETLKDMLANIIHKYTVNMTRFEFYAVLSALESIGAIRKLNASKNPKNKFTLKMKNDRDTLSGNDKIIADYLWNTLEECFDMGGINSVTRIMDIEKTSDDLHIDENDIMSSMLSLECKKFITKPLSYKVNSIKIKDGYELLATSYVCSEKYIDDKLYRDRSRLDNMVAYTHTKDRVQYIRDYFMDEK